MLVKHEDESEAVQMLERTVSTIPAMVEKSLEQVRSRRTQIVNASVRGTSSWEVDLSAFFRYLHIQVLLLKLLTADNRLPNAMMIVDVQPSADLVSAEQAASLDALANTWQEAH